MRRGQPLDRDPLDRAADARQGNRGADRLAYHQLLAVAFRELVGVMACYPARGGVDQRDDRHLDQRGALDRPVEQAKLERMDDVLGIVEGLAGGRAVQARHHVANAPKRNRLIVLT